MRTLSGLGWGWSVQGEEIIRVGVRKFSWVERGRFHLGLRYQGWSANGRYRAKKLSLMEWGRSVKCGGSFPCIWIHTRTIICWYGCGLKKHVLEDGKLTFCCLLLYFKLDKNITTDVFEATINCAMKQNAMSKQLYSQTWSLTLLVYSNSIPQTSYKNSSFKFIMKTIFYSAFSSHAYVDLRLDA